MSALVGALLGHFLIGLALSVPLYLAWLLARIQRAAAWIESRPLEIPPDIPGLPGHHLILGHARAQRTRDQTEALEAVVEHVQSTAHALPDAIVVLDHELRIEWCNRAAERLLGIRPRDDGGQPIENLIRHPSFIGYRHGDDPGRRVLIPSPTDPERVLLIQIIPYGDARQLLLARDETESIRLDQMRRDFISNASHELKTPLTVLGGYLETMTESHDGIDEHWERPLDAMRGQVERMSRLVHDLLLLSRVESVDEPPVRQPVAVPLLLRQLEEEARVMSAGRHHITTLAEPDLYLRGEESELRAAFSNLITNAVRYTPPGGEIRVSWALESGHACLTVEDTGEGIDPSHLPRLTERFFRVDPGRSREHGGTGLGLAIVKHVLNHYQAQLEISSRPGKGSTFTCRFPEPAWTRIEADQPAAPRASNQA